MMDEILVEVAKNPMVVGLAFVLGTLIGSFLNVVGLRLLREEELVKKGSYCYRCQSPIAAKDNIPILSYLMLMGKCRHCKAPISWQYPAVELLTGVLTAGLLYQFGFTWQTLLLAVLCYNLVVILITDFREQYIYDINSLGLIPFGLLYSFITHPAGAVYTFEFLNTTYGIPLTFIDSIIAIGVPFGIFLLLNMISLLLFRRGGFGLGDLNLMIGIGAYFGWLWMVLILGGAMIIQFLLSFPMLLWKWYKQKAYDVIGMVTGSIICGLMLYTFLYAIDPAMMGDTVVLITTLLLMGLSMVLLLRGVLSAAKLGLVVHPFGPYIVMATFLVIFCRPEVSQFLAWALKAYMGQF